ncbi:MAG: 3-hydroxybutyryl-CoA dehydrogenase [Actinobacteria bacterium]|nr:3-hydroxybutyryl-CoA dehydrogenase [Actinomycetota bacterium]
MDVKRVGIVGSGTMGSGVAEVAVTNGFETVLRSRSKSGADSALADVQASLDRQVEKDKLTEDERDATLGLLRVTTSLDDLGDCDLVIESVVEDLPTKKALFADLDKACSPEAVLTTNTSTLPVVEMAMATQRPEQVCGLHFFNPATLMSLVELVRPETASPETMATARSFAEACGKEVVETRDEAGFVVNALLFPYLNNAVRLLEAGVASAEDIDRAMCGGCNFPMGPLALLDLVGIDVSVAILDALHEDRQDPNFAPVPRLRNMVEAGHLGRKTGKGFFEYGS